MLPQETVDELDLREYVQVLRRRKWTVIFTVLVIAGVAFTSAYLQTPSYAASAKLLLRPRSAGTLFGQQNLPSNQNTARSVQTEIEVISAEPVRELVRQKIGSAPSVQVRPVGETDVVTIRAEGTNARQTAVVANAYAEAYIEFRLKQAVQELSSASEELQTKITDLNLQLENLGSQLAAAPACSDPRTTPEACSQRANIEQTVTSRRTTLLSQLGLFQQRLDQLHVDSALATGGAQIVTPASTPLTPFAPRPTRTAVLGGLVGLVFGVGLAFLREHLDDSIKGRDDLARAVPGMTVLGLMPLVADWRAKDEARLVSVIEPNSTAAEAYRILRTSIQFMGLDRSVRIIQLTSPGAQEGKTTTIANLAVAFAASGLRTVVVDCDLRRPRLHQFFGVSNSVGFTSVLLGNVALPKALQQVPNHERLLVLASGPLPPNPSELLSSQRTTEVFQSLSSQTDIVLVDSPPTLPVTDAIVLSQRVDSVVLVTTASVTTQKAAARAAEMLQQVNAPLVGAVLNGVGEETGYNRYSSYGYYSQLGSTNGEGTKNGDAAVARSERKTRRRAKRNG